jgi:hypothetical protein
MIAASTSDVAEDWTTIPTAPGARWIVGYDQRVPCKGQKRSKRSAAAAADRVSKQKLQKLCGQPTPPATALAGALSYPIVASSLPGAVSPNIHCPLLADPSKHYYLKA